MALEARPCRRTRTPRPARREARRPPRAKRTPIALPCARASRRAGSRAARSMSASAAAAPSSLNAVSLRTRKSGRRDAGVAQQVLGEHLVARDRSRRPTREPVYGMPSDLEQLLDGAVLAARGRAAPRTRRRAGPRAGARRGRGRRRSRSRRARAAAARPRRAPPETQRDLPLERPSALQDGDPSCTAHRASRRPSSGAAPRQLEDVGEIGARRGLAARLRDDARRSACRTARPARATIAPIRRTPSRMSSELDAGEVQPHLRRRRARRGRRARPGTKATLCVSARARRSVVSR